MKPRTLIFGAALVTIDREECCVQTLFQDGSLVLARPNFTDEDRARARSLGYPGVYEMTLEHDVLHSFLAQRRGLDASPVLWAVAHGEELPGEVAGREEALVLAFARYMNDVAAFDPCLDVLDDPGAARREALLILRQVTE